MRNNIVFHRGSFVSARWDWDREPPIVARWDGTFLTNSGIIFRSTLSIEAIRSLIDAQKSFYLPLSPDGELYHIDGGIGGMTAHHGYPDSSLAVGDDPFPF